MNEVNSNCTKHPISNYLSYTNISDSQRILSSAISSTSEPENFQEAVKIPEWRSAMEAELTALDQNKTWTIVPLPTGKHSICCKRTYKIKHKQDGNIHRYKARLVAMGYTQHEGIDYTDTHSPVAKISTVKMLLAITLIKRCNLKQLDVNNAFLHGDLFEEIYMDIMPLLQVRSTSNSSNQKLACKLHKSIYGLKQFAQQWYSKLSSFLLKVGFNQSKNYYFLFFKGRNDDFIVV